MDARKDSKHNTTNTERQNDEFETVIKSCEISNAYAAIDDQPTVHKRSQQVSGI